MSLSFPDFWVERKGDVTTVRTHFEPIIAYVLVFFANLTKQVFNVFLELSLEL